MPAKENNDDFKEDLEKAAEMAGRYTRQLFEKGSHMADGADSLAEAIREEPLKAALITLGLGFILGAIIRR